MRLNQSEPTVTCSSIFLVIVPQQDWSYDSEPQQQQNQFGRCWLLWSQLDVGAKAESEYWFTLCKPQPPSTYQLQKAVVDACRSARFPIEISMCIVSWAPCVLVEPPVPTSWAPTGALAHWPCAPSFSWRIKIKPSTFWPSVSLCRSLANSKCQERLQCWKGKLWDFRRIT